MNHAYDNLLNALLENEVAVGNLYRQFGESFPKDSPFWSKLALEESEHARWIETLQGYVRKDILRVKIWGTNVKAVRTSIKYLNIVAEKCKKGEITRIDTFTIAHNTEHSMIEKNFFGTFEMDQPAFRKIMDRLADETKRHREMLQLAIVEMKAKK
jgi:hypothetical protein